MTAELTIPADVWACKQPGVPLVAAIMEGEREPIRPPIYRSVTQMLCPYCKGELVEVDNPFRREIRHRRGGVCDGAPFGPPAWLVALRDACCGVCDGKGRVWVESRMLARCPGKRCHNGRLLHDVRVECSEARFHVRCSDYCSRTVRCLVDVVPIRHVFDPIDDLAELSVDPRVGSVWLMGHDSDNGPLTPAHVEALVAACGKPPADWVGGYAVILTTTDQEAE